MNTKWSKTRETDKTNEISPKKTASEGLESPSSVNYDVTIVIEGQRFHCLKEELSQHSMYFQRMFNSNFQEKNKNEVELGGIVESAVFDMFLNVIRGEGVVTDVTVENLLELADYLESETLEAICIQHLGQKTGFSLADQFEMAETYHSEKLMIQICASIKDAYELDEVVPKDLDSFCNNTKNLVLQRSFELLGIRRPPSPPLPEDPDQVFENRMNQIIDQVEIQNLRGEILKDQIELLVEDVLLKQYLSLTDKDAGRMFRDDPLMKELTDQLRDVHEQSERNFIQAQIQVLKWKIIYARLQNREFIMDENIGTRLSHAILGILTSLAPFLNRDKRSQSRSHKVTLGDREIDEIYRRITAEAIERSQPERPRNLEDNAVWLQKINFFNRKLERSSRHVHIFAPRSRPDNLRVVSDQASFRLINELVSNARNVYYTTVRENQPERNEEDDINREIEAQDPQEQDQQEN
ncbi:unnamed protein product [Caenorhabditis brenneri]